jgi:NAD(P)-dependent dehydrogenase (short-subunit alcohol dehydrogenase family)
MSDRRVALVTGSTSGIGLGIVRRLAAEGYVVVIHSRTSADAGRALADELGDAFYVQADLARDEERCRLVHETVAAAGRLDVLVNNAGISGAIPHADLQDVASHAGVRPKGASIPYAASKAALVHTTKLLSVTLAPEIRVNAVAPGLVDTPLTETWEAARTLWRERSPMRRAATPADIAQCVIALIDSDYLTGEVLLADGGLNLT